MAKTKVKKKKKAPALKKLKITKKKISSFWGDINPVNLANVSAPISAMGLGYGSGTVGCPTTCSGGHINSGAQVTLNVACCM